MRTRVYCALTVMLPWLWASTHSSAQPAESGLGFGSERWDVEAGRVVEHLGQKAFMGRALLRDIEFQDGVIEVDIAFEGGRTFAGLLFRVQSPDNHENFYLRPHKSNLPDALQYQPIIQGSSTWQLYSGEGFTAAAEIPPRQWIHVKMEISGSQAKVYLDNRETPSLVVTDLKHGVSRGAIGVAGPPDGAAYFANFNYRTDDDLDFEAPPRFETPHGMIMDWQLSQSFKTSEVDLERYPDDALLSKLKWRTVEPETNGLVNVSRTIKREGNEPDLVYAKTTIQTDEAKPEKLLIGYSDAVSVFLNGTIVFSGFSEYRRRDDTFLGIIGLNDAVYLPLREGDNELLLAVAESFAGWGFMARDADALFLADGVESLWETPKVFRFPESAVFDRGRETIYVTNYDAYQPSRREGAQFISRLSLDGTILEEKWIEGLKNPTGMVLSHDTLYVVERDAIGEIDVETGRVRARYSVDGARFLNDIAVGPSGDLYVSDSAGDTIFRFSSGRFEPWLRDPDIDNPNGLRIHGDQLIVGTISDHGVKSIDLATKAVRTIVRFGSGVIDGIQVDEDGNYLVSHWEGRLYRVTPSGDVIKLIDTSASETKCADFDYVPERHLVIVPTMDTGFLSAYKLDGIKGTTSAK